MQLKWLVPALLVATTSSAAQGRGSRTLNLAPDTAGLVTASLGYSTVLLFDDPVTGAVVGDQDAFKVERVASGLAVKPLVPHATSNLFVTTTERSFAFELVTAAHGQGDYLVRVKSKAIPVNPESLSTIDLRQASDTQVIHTSAETAGVELALQTLHVTPEYSEVTFTLRLTHPARSPRTFEPSDLAMLSGSTSLPIEHLYLDRLTLSEEPLGGSIVVGRNSLKGLVLAFSPSWLRPADQVKLRLSLKPKVKHRRGRKSP